MANWYGTSRTNYFRVKDADAFRKEMARFHGVELWDDKPGLFGLGDKTGEGWPSWDDSQDTEIDFILLVLKHLADDDVVVFMTCGAEKLRYITGVATAYDSEGEFVEVNIDDIYHMAKEHFGVEPTRAEY